MLEFNPEKRWSADQCLKHEIFKNKKVPTFEIISDTEINLKADK